MFLCGRLVVPDRVKCVILRSVSFLRWIKQAQAIVEDRMRFDFVIDGYNLMHAAGLARQRYGPGDMERARQRLLQLIRHGLTPEQRLRTTIVFDGHSSDRPVSAEFQFHGMLVFFSPPNREADDEIEDFISEHSAPKQLIVVSSDHRLHKAARVRRAHAIDSEEFVEQLQRFAREQRDGTAAESSKTDGRAVPENAEEWFQEFGDIDINEIESDVQREMKRVEKTQREKTPATPKTPASEASAPDIEEEKSDSNENDPELDVDFWENRIAELDQEGE